MTASPSIGMICGRLAGFNEARTTGLFIKRVETNADWVDFMSVYIQCYQDRTVSPQSVNWIGYMNGVPVACVSVKKNRFRGIVYDLGTVPGFRGLGFGRDMVRHALTFLRDHGCRYAHASINRDSEPIYRAVSSNIPGVKGPIHVTQ